MKKLVYNDAIDCTLGQIRQIIFKLGVLFLVFPGIILSNHARILRLLIN
jgi:hypothetical protein